MTSSANLDPAGDARGREEIEPNHVLAHRVRASVLAVALIRDSRAQPLGTAFVISRGGLILTARHVVLEPRRDARPEMQGHVAFFEGDLVALHMPLDSPGRVYSIQEVTSAVSDDVALCQIHPTAQTASPEFSPLPLRPVPPSVGEDVWLFGYNRQDLHAVAGEDGRLSLHLDANGHFSAGVVDAVHWPRKNSLAPFPCFDIRAHAFSGMSGGPVIDERGFVCGVVSHSRSWEPFCTAATLVKALGASINVREGPDGAARETDLSALLQEGFVLHDGSLGKIHIDRESDGTASFAVDGLPPAPRPGHAIRNDSEREGAAIEFERLLAQRGTEASPENDQRMCELEDAILAYDREYGKRNR